MILKPFDLKIQDLPKELEIEVSSSASAEEIDEVVESVKSQVIYNSRGSEEEKALPIPNVEILRREGDLLKLKIAV
jgi:hypothetical protein